MSVKDLMKMIEDRKNKAKETQEVAKSVTSKSERFGHLQDASVSDLSDLETPLPEFWRKAEEKSPGVIFSRIIRSAAAQKKFHGGSNMETPIAGMVDIYKDRPLAKWMEAELQKALSAGTPSEGGYLIPEVLLPGIVDLVVNRMIMMRLGATVIDMPSGNASLSRALTGATATYSGENVSINATQQTLGNLRLSVKKLRTMVAISNDLLKSSSLSVDAFVRNDIVRASLLRKEQAFWLDTGTDNTPRGIKFYTSDSNALNNLTDVTIGGALTADNLLNFMLALISNKIEVDDMGSFGWAMSAQVWRDLMNAKATTNQYLLRQEMMENGTLMGFPFFYTQFLRPNTTPGSQTFDMYFGDWSQVVLGMQGSPEIASSFEASYQDANGTHSAFGEDQSVVRIVDRHDFGLRLPNAIAKSNDVTSNNDQ